MYDLLQFLHVAAAVIWVGSGFGLLTLLTVMKRSGDRQTLMAASQHVETLGPRLFGPASMATLLFGVLAVLVGDIGFTELWIVIGFAGVAVALVATAFANASTKRLQAAVAEHGPDHPQVAASAARTNMLHVVQLVVLFFVVWAMVVKPGA